MTTPGGVAPSAARIKRPRAQGDAELYKDLVEFDEAPGTVEQEGEGFDAHPLVLQAADMAACTNG